MFCGVAGGGRRRLFPVSRLPDHAGSARAAPARVGTSHPSGRDRARLRARPRLDSTAPPEGAWDCFGMSLASIASILGGSGIDFSLSRADAPSLGLDWFALNVLLLAALFVPMERLWPLRPAAEHVPHRVDHRHVLFPDQSPVRATDHVPDSGAGQAAFTALEGQPWREASPDFRWSCSFSPCLLCADLAEYFHPPRVPQRFQSSGASTPSIIPVSTWTGWRARACTSSMSS